MSEQISILQISDIHKPKNGDYEHLYQSLVEDCDRYVNEEGIEKPNFVVVCGDLINGGAVDEIRLQYADVLKFLNKLCDYFLNGDKNRMFIVPGNHDVDWNASKESMHCLNWDNIKDSEKRKEIVEYIRTDFNQDFRWDWNDFNVYRIDDKIKYNNRFCEYQTFYNQFFKDCLSRSFNINPDNQYFVYAFPENHIAFIEFNSAYITDHLCDVGSINKMCITKASEQLRELKEQGFFLCGIWHHHVDGTPYQSNYMDRHLLRTLLMKGIQLGLHGHNHRNEIILEERNIEPKMKMMVVGTGTLYGNRDALPTGVKRLYNIINIHIDQHKAHLKVIPRESIDVNSDEIPEWTLGTFEQTMQPLWEEDLEVRRERQTTGIRKNGRIMNYSQEINDALYAYEQTGNGSMFIETLTNLDMSNVWVRKFCLQILEKESNYSKIIDLFSEPQNDAETISLLQAVEKLHSIEIIKKIQCNKMIQENSNPIIKDLLNKYIFQKKYE